MADDSASESTPPACALKSGGPRRRDVLATATVGLGCVGACAMAVPFLDSLNGTRSEASGESDVVKVDLSSLAPGQQIVVTWRGWPVFVQRRTSAMLAALKAPDMQARLRDPNSKIHQQPRDAANWHRSVVPEIGVYIGICTHLGCVPAYDPPSPSEGAGYACPCHGSQFDAAGRAYRDAPAPYNLPVPPVTILSATQLSIGASSGDPSFDIADIQQI